MQGGLHERLEALRQQQLLETIDLVRSWPDVEERIDAARRIIREAMLRRALGRMTDADRLHIMELLTFAMPKEAGE